MENQRENKIRKNQIRRKQKRENKIRGNESWQREKIIRGNIVRGNQISERKKSKGKTITFNRQIELHATLIIVYFHTHYWYILRLVSLLGEKPPKNMKVVETLHLILSYITKT